MEEKAFEWKMDVQCKTITDDLAVLGVAGPNSRELMSRLTDTDMSHEAFSFLQMKEIPLAGVPVKALRISYSGGGSVGL